MCSFAGFWQRIDFHCLYFYHTSVTHSITLQLTQTLEEDEFARNYRLAYRLDQVHAAMESEVWGSHSLARSTPDTENSMLTLLKTCICWFHRCKYMEYIWHCICLCIDGVSSCVYWRIVIWDLDTCLVAHVSTYNVVILYNVHIYKY